MGQVRILDEGAERTDPGGALAADAAGAVEDQADGLTSDQKLDFAYTDMQRAPEHHVTVAYQFAMGMQLWDISGSTGYTPAYIEKILSHPPVIAAVVNVKEALNKRVLQSLNTWTQLLDDAIGVLDKSLKSNNERVALTAAVEYLDRHPSGMFIKRKQADGSGGSKVMDNNAVDELKRHALKLKGEEDARGIEDRSGEASVAQSDDDYAAGQRSGQGGVPGPDTGSGTSGAGDPTGATDTGVSSNRGAEESERGAGANGEAAADSDGAQGSPGVTPGGTVDNGLVWSDGGDAARGTAHSQGATGGNASPGTERSDWEARAETGEEESVAEGAAEDLEILDPL